MDEHWAPVLLFGPIVAVVFIYLLAWRGRSAQVRRAGAKMLAIVCGLAALFGSLWALGMTFAAWSGGESFSFTSFALRLVAECIVLFFPAGLWYLCAKYASQAANQERDSNKGV